MFILPGNWNNFSFAYRRGWWFVKHGFTCSSTDWLCKKKEEFSHPKKPHVEKKKPLLKAHTTFRTLNVLKLLIDFCYLETKIPSMTDRSNTLLSAHQTFFESKNTCSQVSTSMAI